MHLTTLRILFLALLSLGPSTNLAQSQEQASPLRVFVFAGQSNMVGTDSKVEDIRRFPPFAGLEEPQDNVMFSYNIGREVKHKSEGWVPLAPVDGVVGPELSFARTLVQHIDDPIAVIKVAAGGTDLGADWNPDNPQGYVMYPLALDRIQTALAELDEREIAYVLEGFVWHQGESDMFNEEYMAAYGANLAKFVTAVRRDLEVPDLRFYVGELCTKTIWGMDLRPRMDAIAEGQKEVAAKDELVQYIPTAHVGVEIGARDGLHYHYGTLGQLEHGLAYADAYLRTRGITRRVKHPLETWPYSKGSTVKLFVLAGHRNMEGERAFVQELANLEGGEDLLENNPAIAYRYDIGGGQHLSDGWEPLGPAGDFDTFGPEISFAQTVDKALEGNIAIAKFTHSGSQIVDWSPEGSEAPARNLYPAFLAFVRDSMQDLTDQGQRVELAGVVYHLGENDTVFGPFRKQAATWLQSLVNQSRVDLDLPDLLWLVSQQPPSNHESVRSIDVTAQVAEVAEADPNLVHLKAFALPAQAKELVLDTPGVVALGKLLAASWLTTR